MLAPLSGMTPHTATLEPQVLPGTSGKTRNRVQMLLACGVIYAVIYVVANDVIAASLYPGYSRVTQAVSELSATGAPTRMFLLATLPICSALMIAFGIGVLRAARGRRALRVAGWAVIAHGVSNWLWLPFPMTSREQMIAGASMPANDVGHIAMTVLTVSLILTQLTASAIALGTRFRIFAVAMALTILGFGALTGRSAADVASGDTPWMGLYERILMGAWLLWLVVFSIAMSRRWKKA